MSRASQIARFERLRVWYQNRRLIPRSKIRALAVHLRDQDPRSAVPYRFKPEAVGALHEATEHFMDHFLRNAAVVKGTDVVSLHLPHVRVTRTVLRQTEFQPDAYRRRGGVAPPLPLPLPPPLPRGGAIQNIITRDAIKRMCVRAGIRRVMTKSLGQVRETLYRFLRALVRAAFQAMREAPRRPSRPPRKTMLAAHVERGIALLRV